LFTLISNKDSEELWNNIAINESSKCELPLITGGGVVRFVV